MTANKKMVIAGGTGFIGSYLKEQFIRAGYNVLIVSRENGDVHWDDAVALGNALEHADILINLAGKSINCRHTDKNKKAIIQSRVKTTTQLGETVLKCQNPPALWINASGANIYADDKEHKMTEDNGVIGGHFLADVAIQWEKAFFSFKLPATRQAALRQGVVLGKGGGFMKPFLTLARLGLGGRQGDGTQMFSWVHIEDLFNIILFIHRNHQLHGAFNCAAPGAIRNSQLMKALRDAVHMPIGIPAPEWALTIGGLLINTEPSLALTSCWAFPEKLLAAGYNFKFPAIEAALHNIVH